MSDDDEEENVVPFVKVPSIPEAQKIIKRLVMEGKVSWRAHAKDRLKERDVTIIQALNCLERGRITEAPFWTHSYGGGYETRVEGSAAGEWLRVVVCLRIKQDLLVISVVNDN